MIVGMGFYRVPFKGVYQGYYKGSIVGFYSIGAFIVRIGFGGILYHNGNKETPKPYFNY